MIVEKFGGEIDFTSKYKRGTTFFYTFEIGEPFGNFDRVSANQIMKGNSNS